MPSPESVLVLTETKKGPFLYEIPPKNFTPVIKHSQEEYCLLMKKFGWTQEQERPILGFPDHYQLGLNQDIYDELLNWWIFDAFNSDSIIPEKGMALHQYILNIVRGTFDDFQQWAMENGESDPAAQVAQLIADIHLYGRHQFGKNDWEIAQKYVPVLKNLTLEKIKEARDQLYQSVPSVKDTSAFYQSPGSCQ